MTEQRLINDNCQITIRGLHKYVLILNFTSQQPTYFRIAYRWRAIKLPYCYRLCTVFSLLETIQSLENKCDELQSTLDKTKIELDNERRQRLSKEVETTQFNPKDAKKLDSASVQQTIENCANCSEMLAQLQEAKSANVKEQRLMDDLKDQMSALIQVNNSGNFFVLVKLNMAVVIYNFGLNVEQDNEYLKHEVNKLQHKEDEIKSVQEELATLEQIR